MPLIADFDQSKNPYRSSGYSTVETMPDAYDDPQVAELQAFVGRKANYYLRKWAPRLESPEGEAGMNWAAFFLTGLWMGYRKMYWNLVLTCGAATGVVILLEVLFVFVFQSKTTPPSVHLLTNLMIAMVCGVYGNAWYLAHAKRKIAAARAQGLEGSILLNALAHRGGTSLLSGIGLVVAVNLGAFMVAFVLGVMIQIVKRAAM